MVARNHQFIGVNKAIEHFQVTRQKAKDGLISIEDAQKLGVFWHTQGSGKSYSMVFLCQKILRVLENHKAEYARILEQDMPQHLRKQAI